MMASINLNSCFFDSDLINYQIKYSEFDILAMPDSLCKFILYKKLNEIIASLMNLPRSSHFLTAVRKDCILSAERFRTIFRVENDLTSKQIEEVLQVEN